MAEVNKVRDLRKRNSFISFGYEPIPICVQVHNCDKKIIVILAGNRCSKSSSFVAEATFEGLDKKSNIWVANIDYKMTDRFLWGAENVKGVIDYIKEIDPGLIFRESRRDHTLVLKNGTVYQGKSVKYPDSFIAEAVNLIVLEDAMSFPDGFYGKYIRPRVIDTKGRILINSIPPFGKKNWLTSLFEKENERIGRFSWGMKDNPYLSREEIEALTEETPEHLRASIIYGDTSAGENSLFGNIRDKAVSGMHDWVDGHIYQGGLDIGKTFDRTVIAISDLTEGRLAYIEQFPPRFFDAELVEDKVLSILKRYRFPNTYVDLTSWGERYQRMVDSHPFFIGFTISNLKTRNLLIEEVVMAINRNYNVPNFPPLIVEMENLEVIPRVGYYLYRPSYGHHDDCIMSTALSIHGWARKMYNATLDLTPKEIEPDSDSFIIKDDEDPIMDIGDASKILDSDLTFIP